MYKIDSLKVYSSIFFYQHLQNMLICETVPCLRLCVTPFLIAQYQLFACNLFPTCLHITLFKASVFNCVSWFSLITILPFTSSKHPTHSKLNLFPFAQIFLWPPITQLIPDIDIMGFSLLISLFNIALWYECSPYILNIVSSPSNEK